MINSFLGSDLGLLSLITKLQKFVIIKITKTQ